MASDSQARTKDASAGVVDVRGRIVLLATDGSPAARAATRVAQGLAVEHHAEVHVVSVVDTRSAPIPPPLDLALALADTSSGQAIHAQQVRDVREMISATTAQPCEWPVHVVLGTPAGAIASTAKRIGAALIVLGLRHHGRVDRVTHDETVLNLIQMAECGVLGVSETLSALPVRGLVALDFTPASEEAARAALYIVGPKGKVVLTYAARITGYEPGDGETVIHEMGVQAGFERIAAELRQAGGTVDHVVLHHQTPRPVADLLLDYAHEMSADLIVSGRARHGRVDRWMLGSVSTELVRAGTTSILVIPPVAPRA